MPPSNGLNGILLCAEAQDSDHIMKVQQHFINVREVQSDAKTAVVESISSEKEPFQNNENVLQIWFHSVSS